MGNQLNNQRIEERVRKIIEQDLMLDSNASLDLDTPLFGEQTELDSLDALLLVTRVEKEFGIKIPNESIGRDVFQNVSTLVTFVEAQLSRQQAAEGV